MAGQRHFHQLTTPQKQVKAAAHSQERSHNKESSAEGSQGTLILGPVKGCQSSRSFHSVCLLNSWKMRRTCSQGQGHWEPAVPIFSTYLGRGWHTGGQSQC